MTSSTACLQYANDWTPPETSPAYNPTADDAFYTSNSQSLNQWNEMESAIAEIAMSGSVLNPSAPVTPPSAGHILLSTLSTGTDAFASHDAPSPDDLQFIVYGSHDIMPPIVPTESLSRNIPSAKDGAITEDMEHILCAWDGCTERLASGDDKIIKRHLLNAHFPDMGDIWGSSSQQLLKMTLSRSNLRSKSRSPAPNAPSPILASRTPVFLPPSHYAAAAGLSYPAAQPPSNTPVPTSDLLHDRHTIASPVVDPSPDRYKPIEHIAPPSPAIAITSPLNRVSRFISRSPSRSSSLSLRRASSKKGLQDREKDATNKRQSHIADIPLVELQLIPTLRDTVDKMTHPQPPTVHSEESEPESMDSGVVARIAAMRSPEPAYATATHEDSQYSPNPYSYPALASETYPSPPRSSPYTHGIPQVSFTPKLSLKPALRTQTLAAYPDPPVSQSLRKARPVIPRPAIHTPQAHANEIYSIPIPRGSGNIPAASNRDLAEEDSSASERSRGKSMLPLPKARKKSRSNPGTPKAPSSNYPGFTTPQLAQTPVPASRIPINAGSGLPRPRNVAANAGDSGSDLERRVGRAYTPGKLVVTNAQVVPSSSESDDAIRGAYIQSERQRPIGPQQRAIPTSGIPARGHHQVRFDMQAVVQARSSNDTSRPTKRPVGLGFNIEQEAADSTRTAFDEPSDDDNSIDDEHVGEDARYQDTEDEESVYEEQLPTDNRQYSHLRNYMEEHENGKDQVPGRKMRESDMSVANDPYADYESPKNGQRSLHARNARCSYHDQGSVIQSSEFQEDITGVRSHHLPPVVEQRTLEDAYMYEDESNYSEEDRDMEHPDNDLAEEPPRSLRSSSGQSAQESAQQCTRDRLRDSQLRPQVEPDPGGISRSLPRPRSISPTFGASTPEADPDDTTLTRSRNHSDQPLSAKDIRARNRMTMTVTAARDASSKRLSRLSNSSVKANEAQDHRSSRGINSNIQDNSASVRNTRRRDASDRERAAFGIPRSLSYGASSSPEGSGVEDASRPNSILRSESDESLIAGLRRLNSNTSSIDGGRSLLSKGAHTLFEALTSRNPVRQPEASRSCSGEGSSRPESRQSASGRLSPQPRAAINGANCSGPGYAAPLHATPPIPSGSEDLQDRSGTPMLSSSLARPSWRSTVQPSAYGDLESRYGSLEMQRQEQIYQFYVAEQTIVKQLRAIVRSIILPLRCRDSRSWLPGVPTEVSRLFDWLDDIVNLHIDIARAVKAACRSSWQADTIVERIADVILPFVPRFEIYQPYIVRIDEVKEIVATCREHGGNELGEYLRMKEQEGACDGQALDRLLEEPTNNLNAYPAIFQQLLDATPKHHSDYMATLSLFSLTKTMIRVMDEVRIREEEYDFVKDFASRFIGLQSSAPLAKRERRLLQHGFLHFVQSAEVVTPSTPVPPLVQVNGKPVTSPGSTPKLSQQNVPQRASRLASAIHSWHTRRKRSGSLTSSASSSLSVRSYETATSDTMPETPVSYSNFHQGDNSRDDASANADGQPGIIPVQAFVFTDLLLLGHPTPVDMGNGREPVEGWTLLDNVGTSKILSIVGQEEVPGIGQIVTLDVLPLSIEQVEAGLGAETTSISQIFLVLQGLDLSKEWLDALQRCRYHTIHSLSYPPRSADKSDSSGFDDFELDTYHSVKAIMASGLPLPKSPSMQFEDQQQERHVEDATEQEREERGWWSLRFQQVMREMQRQDRAGRFP
ncbi:hypothetical protein WOLCODRAFT_165828 [Wolfiporia cocos MD-104 SS10]|uniref:DH domain-containing protein n=1 Tax=Wolfiporia cocos (strain MD-104) TaxID=742152 RepID=A0A2H3J4U4_WOLCO|nr:hypothetical protein WOLCODRAFT_165828 [Wolfiporia cocos MD-104 SS10]